MLRVTRSANQAMIGHAIAQLPIEACGLMGGRSESASVARFVPARNIDASARTYAIGPDGFAAADDVFEPLGLEVVGVMHSHTHTDPYPSPTDVARADNPLLAGWHYVIVSLRDREPMVRAWLLDGATIVEEPLAVVEG